LEIDRQAVEDEEQSRQQARAAQRKEFLQSLSEFYVENY
jgi:hypothetical protein